MSNPAVLVTERRSEERISAYVDLTSSLKKIDSEEPVRSILVDISTIGIGIKSFDYLKPDSVVRITLAGEEKRFRIAWSKSDSVKENLWHIGLLAIDPVIDLKEWFARHDIHIGSNQKKGFDRRESESELDINLTSIRELICAAHTCDRSFFSQSGLEQLMENRRAYPINYRGSSLVVLLPKELKPRRVSELSDKEAESNIAVFRRIRTGVGDNRWVLVWPR